VDEGAVRNTRDVDLLIDRADLQATRSALEAAAFIYQQVLDIDTFLEGPDGRPNAGVHVHFAGEKVKLEHVTSSPNLADCEPAAQFQVVKLAALVQTKLDWFRLIDRVHLRDLIDVGLVDHTWPARMPSELAPRLQHLLDTPDG
jgi:hypothetical protein